METLKKYWWVVAAVVLYMLMGKKKKTTRKRRRMSRMSLSYYGSQGGTRKYRKRPIVRRSMRRSRA